MEDCLLEEIWRQLLVCVIGDLIYSVKWAQVSLLRIITVLPIGVAPSNINKVVGFVGL